MAGYGFQLLELLLPLLQNGRTRKFHCRTMKLCDLRKKEVQMGAKREPQVRSSALLERLDLRTKDGRRAEIIAQVEESGGFSVFWITEHRLRAIVGTEMMERGELVETHKSSFPWHALKVVGRSNISSTK